MHAVRSSSGVSAPPRPTPLHRGETSPEDAKVERGGDHSQVNVALTSNAGGSPVASRLFSATLRPVLVAMHCASAGGHPVQVALRNTPLSVNRRRTFAAIGALGFSWIDRCAHDVQALAVLFNERSFALVAPLDRGAPSCAWHVAGLNADDDAGAGAMGVEADGAGALGAGGSATDAGACALTAAVAPSGGGRSAAFDVVAPRPLGVGGVVCFGAFCPDGAGAVEG